MDKFISYIVGLILVGFCLLPHIGVAVRAHGEWFQYFIYLAGFLSFYIWFTKINVFVKIIPVLCLVNAMMSYVPLLSFYAWFQVLACCYFYVLCSKVRDFDIVFKMLQSILFLTCVLYIMKFVGHEPIANFSSNAYFGTNGQHMQSASLMTILVAVLAGFSKWNFLAAFLASGICNSVGAFISATTGFIVSKYNVYRRNKRYYLSILFLFLVIALWMWVGGKWSANMSTDNSRLVTWVKTIVFSLEYPFFGWGIGTYKTLFPVIGKTQHGLPWNTAHNDYLQLLFEMGITGCLFFASYSFILVFRLVKLLRRSIFKHKALMCLVGLSIIGTNMIYHFPMRMTQAVPLIIFFLAYCEKIISLGGKNGNK